MRKKLGSLDLVLFGAYVAAFGTLTYFFWMGFDYYSTPYAQRPHHPDFRVFRPGGHLGLTFGIVGSVLMIGLLLYVVRKRTSLFGNWLRLSGWLRVHILMGVIGPIFILLHTSFKLNGLVAISFWAMVFVALSGVFGRFLYVQIPRNIRGDQLSLAQIEAEDQALTLQIATDSGLSADAVEILIGNLQEYLVQRRFLGVSGRRKSLEWWHQVAPRLDADAANAPEDLAKLIGLARTKMKLARRVARLDMIHRLFHYWHIIHRPFAAVMYIFMILHIVIALLFGISWSPS